LIDALISPLRIARGRRADNPLPRHRRRPIARARACPVVFSRKSLPAAASPAAPRWFQSGSRVATWRAGAANRQSPLVQLCHRLSGL